MILSLQRQKFKRHQIKLAQKYPVPRHEDGEENVFVRDIPIAAGGVGGGLWEAGEMMARWIYRNRERIQAERFNRCLELGSGVGETGLTLATVLPTYLTDYRREVLENLFYNRWMNDTDPDEKVEPPARAEFARSAGLIARNAKIAHLDWFSPLDPNAPPAAPGGPHLLPPNVSELVLDPLDRSSGSFDLISGSELSYCLETVDALADTVAHFLSPDGVFIHICSRFRGDGPHRLYLKLEAMGFRIEARPAPAWLYEGLQEKEQRERGEEYLLWTCTKGQRAFFFGDEGQPALDWKGLRYELRRE